MVTTSTRTVRSILHVFLALVSSATVADEADFAGVVTRVFDGDSFLVRPANKKDIDVRLQDVDAPEKDQPYADISRAALTRLIEGRQVFVDVIETDKYGRKIAKVYREADRLEIARALVHDGHVWVNRKYAKDRSLVELEEKARAKHEGLWSLSAEQLVPPWDFRRSKSLRNRKERVERNN
jgi:endonuclease YncB( thermonuclease family)